MNIIPKPQKITFSGKYVPKGSVTESVDADMGKEEYSLNINRDGVFLKGGSERAPYTMPILRISKFCERTGICFPNVK